MKNISRGFGSQTKNSTFQILDSDALYFGDAKLKVISASAGGF